MGNRSQARAVIGLFVLALVAFLTWNVSQRDTTALNAVDPAPGSPASPVAAEPLPEVSGEPRAELPALPLGARAAVAQAPEAVPESPAEIQDERLQGSVVLNDPDGTPRAAPSGTLTLFAWDESLPSRIEVDVTHGEWSVPYDRVQVSARG